ncbi:MAG: amino acid ABC transporter ATP-binding protein [Synergistaceae bacterium]|nr:amino acid ABC transporter ATP-binding protein [Synergistaceae bacterium]
MIRLENIHKTFHKLEVLRGVNLRIGKGEVVAIVGPSGSGKSTLLRCINMLETPTRGKVFIKGQEITGLEEKELRLVRQNIGMVFQLFNLFPHMTALQNICYAPIQVKGIRKALIEEKAMDLLRMVGLVDKADVYPAKLSGGQKQRVAIARALAMEPEMMLFDEPTSALDPEMVKEVLLVIKDLARTGITMALVTHEMNFAREVAHRIVFLDEGVMLEDETPAEFFSNPKTERARQFLDKML